MMLHHYGEVMKFLVLSFFYLISQYSFSDELLKEKNLEIEPKYYLIPKHKYEGKPIVLYSTPDVNGKIVKEVYINENKYWDADTFRKFDDNKKHPFPGLVVASTEKKDSFYKVYFESRYLWVEEGSFKKVYDMKSYFKRLSGSISFRLVYNILYLNIGDSPLSKQKAISLMPKGYDSSDPDVGFKVLKVVNEKEKTWIYAEVCTIYNYRLGGDVSCVKPLRIWMRPFHDNGQATRWAYPYKSVNY
jgi:hypothetical protein